MRLSADRQAIRLLLAMGLGFGIGLLYDLLRPLRRRMGRVGTALLDILFSLLAGAAAFCFAMGAGSGRMGLWELSAALLGFLLYLHTLSIPISFLLGRLLLLVDHIIGSCKKVIHAGAVSAKRDFQNVRKWFILLK